MVSTRTFSPKKPTSPASEGSALKPRQKGGDEGVSSPKNDFNKEGFFEGEGSSCLLGTSESLRPLSSDEEEQDRAKKSRNARYTLLRELSRNVWNGKLPWHSVRHCSRSAIPSERRKASGEVIKTKMPGTIQIQYREQTHNHNYHGLSRCASALVCPVCSAIIQSRRAAEVMQAGQYLLQHGFQVAMITQTASHNRNTSLYDFIQRFQAAQRDMKEHKAYKTWQKKTGAKFTIRAVEVTDDKPDYEGRKSGWHYHTHTLVFFERDKAFAELEVQHFTELFQKMWIKALNGVGLSGSTERAADVRLPRANNLLDDAKASGNDENIRNLCAYIAKAFGWEVSGGRSKKGRDEKDRRISVWQLQEAALTDRPELLYRYAEYMRAVRGVNWLRWSQGLKDFCGIKEVSDVKLMEGEEGDQVIWEFTNASFKKIWMGGFQGKLIEVADTGGTEALEKVVTAIYLDCDLDGSNKHPFKAHKPTQHRDSLTRKRAEL